MQLGDYLRQLRRSQRLTLAQLGVSAGVSLTTLSRWETGAFQPRLSELEAALRALGASSGQWERALSLVEAPRAVARLREEAQQRQADLVELAGYAPALGDLCCLLAVTPEERLALSQQRLWLWTPEWKAPLSLEAAEQQCDRLTGQM